MKSLFPEVLFVLQEDVHGVPNYSAFPSVEGIPEDSAGAKVAKYEHVGDGYLTVTKQVA
jgi:hypothetical protein